MEDILLIADACSKAELLCFAMLELSKEGCEKFKEEIAQKQKLGSQ